jgi:pyruvate/2-oxoacid:ferredoxin oxidoreductase beta subunit
MTLSFVDQGQTPYPFCPGCSHGKILDSLNQAMVQNQLDPARTVVVTDIGCVGLSDQWFHIHSIHGLHGRSVLYAQGVKLSSPELQVIVLMGDGAAGIGGHHLISAARRNIGIKVILFNNFNYGMTGGQHSATTPESAFTASTRSGNLEKPFKITETLLINGATFGARRAYYDPDLVTVFQDGLSHNGFAIIEVLEFCTAYYVPMNNFKKSGLEAILTKEQLPRILEKKSGINEYTQSYSARSADLKNQPGRNQKSKAVYLENKFSNSVTGVLSWILAGSAGQKIKSSAAIIAQAAILSGLRVTQKNDYPVTVKTGHSLAYLKLSNRPISSPAFQLPDALFIISEDGLKKALEFIHLMESGQRIFILSSLARPKARAKIIPLHLEQQKIPIPKSQLLLFIFASFLKSKKFFPEAALIAALNLYPRKELEQDLKIIELAGTNIF